MSSIVGLGFQSSLHGLLCLSGRSVEEQEQAAEKASRKLAECASVCFETATFRQYIRKKRALKNGCTLVGRRPISLTR